MDYAELPMARMNPDHKLLESRICADASSGSARIECVLRVWVTLHEKWHEAMAQNSSD